MTLCTFIGAIVVVLLAVGLVIGFITTRRFAQLRAESGMTPEEFGKAGTAIFKANAFGPQGEEARRKVVESIRLQTGTFLLATGGILYIVYVCNG